MSEFITPSVLAERIQKKTGINAELAKRFSIEFFAIARRCLKQDDTFIVHRFGTFKKLWVEESVGRNPQTNEEITIPAHWRIKFTPAKAVADRINKKYAHLKPKLINEKKKTVKVAENDFFQTDLEQNTQEINEKEFKSSIENSYDSDDFIDDAEDEKKSPKLPLLLAIILLILAVLSIFLFRQCANNKTQSKKEAEPKKNNNEQAIEETVTETEPIKTAEEEQMQKATSTEYLVPAGSCYYRIAEEKFGNRHVWPIIYAENMHQNQDPDLIKENTTIFIPAADVITTDIQNSKDAYLKTYQAYCQIIELQKTNKKNPIRQFRAVRVLVSGEIIFPGFIEENKSKISQNDYQDAIAIMRNRAL